MTQIVTGDGRLYGLKVRKSKNGNTYFTGSVVDSTQDARQEWVKRYINLTFGENMENFLNTCEDGQAVSYMGWLDHYLGADKNGNPGSYLSCRVINIHKCPTSAQITTPFEEDATDEPEEDEEVEAPAPVKAAAKVTVREEEEEEIEAPAPPVRSQRLSKSTSTNKAFNPIRGK